MSLESYIVPLLERVKAGEDIEVIRQELIEVDRKQDARLNAWVAWLDKCSRTHRLVPFEYQD